MGAQGSVPSGSRLQVVAHAADDLRTTQRIGKQDPFLKVNFNGQEQRSKVCSDGGKRASWNGECLEFGLPAEGLEAMVLKVEVRNKNMLSRSDLIGELVITHGDLVSGRVQDMIQPAAEEKAMACYGTEKSGEGSGGSDGGAWFLLACGKKNKAAGGRLKLELRLVSPKGLGTAPPINLLVGPGGGAAAAVATPRGGSAEPPLRRQVTGASTGIGDSFLGQSGRRRRESLQQVAAFDPGGIRAITNTAGTATTLDGRYQGEAIARGGR